MLVLAIAAMIIVMSVRYYQSASASQRANACLSYLQAIVAAADSLSEATQSYKDIGSGDIAWASKQIDAIVPRNEAVCNDKPVESGGGYTVQAAGVSDIDFYIKLPKQACLFMIPALKASGHWEGGYRSGVQINETYCSSLSNGADITYFKFKK